jgi:dynein heavy chain, axonemal
MQPTVLGWQPIVKSWIARLPPYVTPSIRSSLFTLFLRHILVGLEFVREQCEMVIELVDANMVTSLCDLFLALLESNSHNFKQCTVC